MNRMKRMILEIVLTLVIFAVISTMPLVSKVEPVNTITGDSALIGLTAPRPAIPESVWLLCIVLVGLAIVVRRKSV